MSNDEKLETWSLSIAAGTSSVVAILPLSKS